MHCRQFRSLYRQTIRDQLTTKDLRFIKVLKSADHFITKCDLSSYPPDNMHMTTILNNIKFLITDIKNNIE